MTTTLEPGGASAAVPDGKTWEPRIVALVCNWCTYSGADMAGTARRTYAPNVRMVRLLCTGRLDPLFIVRAFQQGTDGVIVSGCHPGDCHYVHGNMLARRRLTVFEALMDFLGLDGRRLRFAWVSASEGVKWSRLVDEVVEDVRAAGPLGEWTAPSPSGDLASFRLPEPEGEPRSRPSAEASERVAVHLRETAARLLADGDVGVVAGYAAGSLPGQTVPSFATRPEEAEAFTWNEHCANNLTVYLPQLLRRVAGGRVGLVVKSCDAGAVVGLLREHQMRREDAVLIGVSCSGVWDGDGLALKCFSCADEVSPLVDWTITPDGAVAGAVTTSADRAVAPDPRDAQIAALETLPAAARWGWWQRQFTHCLRCYACRAACPMCYCTTCIAEKHRPQWIPATLDAAGNTAWNVARAMHLAGRCAGCDECARVCPADVRLDLLNRRVTLEIERRFGPMSDDPGAPAALATFRPDDPDEFS